MGYLNGKVVHYRAGDYCHAMIVTDDQAPTYHQDVTGIQIDPGPGGTGASLTVRADAEHDVIEQDENGSGIAVFTDNTWHYDTECRSYYGL